MAKRSKKTKLASSFKPWATLNLNRPSEKAVDCNFTDFADAAELMADEFNMLASGHPMLIDGCGYTAEQVVEDIGIADPELIAYFIESPFGRGFLLGQGMLQGALQENPGLFDGSTDTDDDEA